MSFGWPSEVSLCTALWPYLFAGICDGREMSKVLVTADLHIYNHGSDIRRIEDGLKCLDWIYGTADNNGIKTVVFCGDFFHNRFLINAYAASRAFEISYHAKLEGIDTIFLLGNHDLYYEDNWNDHSLKAVKEWATVIDKPTKMLVEGIEADFIPYTPTPSSCIDLPIFAKPARTLFSHLAILDAILNSKYNVISVEDDTKQKEVIKADALHKWEKVWLGHYHYGQQVSKQVEYIGSPMSLSYGEADQVKHVALYDMATLQTKYVVNDISPQHHIVTNVKQMNNMVLKDAYVRLDCNVEQKFEIQKKMSKYGVRQALFNGMRLTNEETGKALGNIADLFGDRDKLIDSYIDGMDVPQNLNKDRLKKLGKEIIHAVS
jgi:DNA repair exonuclease SbcCD nuclease subunit